MAGILFCQYSRSPDSYRDFAEPCLRQAGQREIFFFILIRQPLQGMTQLNSNLMEFTDNEIKFAFEEYTTLRAEIFKKIDNQYKILNLGIGGITVLFGLAFKLGINQLFLILPFLIIANNYLYIAESMAIINAGNYIKKLETILYSKFNDLYKNHQMGWENNIKRIVYKPFNYIANAIFISLFCISFFKGIIFILNSPVFCSCDKIVTIVAVIVYSIVPISFYIFVLSYYVKTAKNDKN